MAKKTRIQEYWTLMSHIRNCLVVLSNPASLSMPAPRFFYTILVVAAIMLAEMNGGVAAALLDRDAPARKINIRPSTQSANTLVAQGKLVLDRPLIAAWFDNPGVVTTINVSAGQTVQKGDVLAEIDSVPLNGALMQAQAQLKMKRAALDHGSAAPTANEVERARRELASATAAYELLKTGGGDPHAVEQALRSWNKDKNSLWSKQLSRDDTCGLTPGVSTTADFQRALQDLECKTKDLDVRMAELIEQSSYQAYLDVQKPGTEAQIAQAWATVAEARAKLAALNRGPVGAEKKVAEAEVAQAQRAVDRALRDLMKSKLISPCNCVVQRVSLHVGAAADGDITLLDPSELVFQAAVSERDVMRIDAGQTAAIQLTAQTTSLTGTVAAVLPLPASSAAEPVGYTVILEISQPAGAMLLAGMTGRAEIQLPAVQPPAATASVQATSVVTASGIVALGVLTSTPGFVQPGKIASVPVQAGQTVKKGDVLATIDDMKLQDAVVDAQEALDLAVLKSRPRSDGAPKEEIAAAQAALNAALVNYAAVKAGAAQSEIDSAKRDVDLEWLSYLSAQIERDVHCGTPSGLAAQDCKSSEASFGSAFESWAAAVDKYKKVIEGPDASAVAQANDAVIMAREKLASLKSPASNAEQDLTGVQVDQAGLALTRAQSDLNQARLLSPCDCVVQQVNVAIGTKASANAFVLVDLGAMQFVALMDEGGIVHVKAGAPVIVQLAANEHAIAGKVKAVLAQAPVAGGASGLFEVLVDLDPAHERVLPGMSGHVSIAAP